VQRPDTIDLAMGQVTRLITKKVSHTARLEVTWSDGCGWLAGWKASGHRYAVPGSSVGDAVQALSETLQRMPTLGSRP